MPRQFTCPECQAAIKPPAGVEAGMSFRCPSCGSNVRLQEEQFTSSRPSRRDDDDDFDRPDRPQRGMGLEGLSNNYSIQIGDWFRYAQAHWSAVLGPMIGYLFLYVLMIFGLVITCVGILALPILAPPLAAGFTVVGLAQLKGERWTFGDFFGGFRQFGSILGGVYLVVLIAGLWPVPGAVLQIIGQAKYEAEARARMLDHVPPDDDPFAAFARMQQEQRLHLEDPVVLTGVLLRFVGTIVGIYFQVRCLFVLPLIIDRKCGAVEAVQGSFRLSQGHFWGLLGMTLLMGLINLAGMMACGIGFLFVFPFTQLVLLAGYLLIAGSRRPVETQRTEPAY